MYEDEIRLYTEEQFYDDLQSDQAFKALLSKIDARLPTDSAIRTRDFIEFPLSSVDLVNGILIELNRVFQGKNANFSFEVDNEEKNKVALEIIKGLDVHQYVIDTGKEVFRNKPNNIVVIDKDDQGKPFIVTVETSRLIDGIPLLDGSFDYIAFVHSKGELPEITYLAFYDEVNYTVVEHNSDKSTYVIIKQVAHNIGYCPAHCFMKDAINQKTPYKRRVPISGALGKIRAWQLFDTYSYYNEHFAVFPVIQRMKAKCGNPDCNEGWLQGDPYMADGELYHTKGVECPVCSKATVGVGTIIEITPKQHDEDNGEDTFKFIAPEIEGADYISKKQIDREKYIELKIIGQNNLMSTEAVNVDQVKGSFQSRENILNNLKISLEHIHIWIVETAIRAYFLGDVKITSFANYGTEFYLIDEAELQKRYSNAKTYGMPDAEVDGIYQQLITTKYKDNPDLLTRMELIRLLDPLPHRTYSDAVIYKNNGVLTDTEFTIKARLTSFIDRFELEQADLVVFGKSLPLNERIKAINNILIKYANEFKPNTNPEPPGAGE